MDWKKRFKNKRYNAFNNHVYRQYGERVQKVTVDAGFTCPNRDGTVAGGGCTYCNNESFNPGYNSATKSIRQQIEEGQAFLRRRYKGISKFIAYFQPYSNTYAPLQRLESLYLEALNVPGIVGLTIGTRPDCIDEEKLTFLQDLARQYDITIEYGLESILDETLKKINRGHDFNCYREAVHATVGRGIRICTHLIIGFPWETREDWIRTAGVLSDIPTDFLKIHQLHIVKNTAMEKQHRQIPFKLLTYDEYVEVVVSLLEHLNPEIILQRLSAEAPPHILVAPRWGLRSPQIIQGIEKRMKDLDTWQGRLWTGKSGSETEKYSIDLETI